MIPLETGRHAAVRDLDAIIARLHSLGADDWHRDTPNDGWEVRHLIAHLVGSVAKLTDRLSQVVIARTGEPILMDDLVDTEAVTPDTAPDRLIVSLTHQRNQVRHVLITLEDEDLEAMIADATIPAAQATGGWQLEACVFEFGVHRYDLDAALDERVAGLPVEAIAAANDLYGSRLVEIATREGATPSAPVAFHLDGAVIDQWLTWNGSAWSDRPVDGVPVVHLQGEESALALFLCGRIPADDRRLGIRGSRTEAAKFKTYAPGPFTL